MPRTHAQAAALWYALKAVAGRACRRLAANGRGMARRRRYAFALRIRGTVAGQAIDEKVAGEVWKNPDKPVRPLGFKGKATGQEIMLAAALKATPAADRRRLAGRIKRLDLDRIEPEYIELAAEVLEAHRVDDKKAGEVQVEVRK